MWSGARVIMAGDPNSSTPLRTGSAVWIEPPPPRPGTLTLTTEAITFDGPGGRGPPPMRPMFRGPRPMRPGFGPRGGPGGMGGGSLRIPLWRCRGATAVNGPQGPALQLELLSRRVVFGTPEAAAWAAAINEARARAPPPPPGVMAGPGGAGRGAMPRCEYCGQLSQPSATKCESCGAPF